MKQPDKHVKYFEGILQLRNPSEELLKYVYRTIDRDNRAWIGQEKKVRGGIDLYLSSQKYIRTLGKKLKERFPGDLKTSRKLFTVQRGTGKRLYRVNVLFRLYPFKVGSDIEMSGEKYKVLRIENQITVQNIKSGKKEKIKPDEIERWI
jgi:NMD protein affecting ribosome stability and mRNA decay